MRTLSHLGIWSFALFPVCVSGTLHAEEFVLQEVRHSTQGGVTRVAVQLSGPAEIRRDRLSKPDRYFFDFQHTSPPKRGMQTIAVGDALLRQIRIAEPRAGIARVVLDLADHAEVTTSELTNPYRLIIELRKPGSAAPAPAVSAPVIAAAPAVSAQPLPERRRPQKTFRPFVPPPSRPALLATAILPLPPSLFSLPVRTRLSAIPQPPRASFPAFRSTNVAKAAPPVTVPPAAKAPPPVQAARVTPAPPEPASADAPPAGSAVPAQPSQTARRGTTGGNSMTRALGLKIRRVVLDPGHGGHDQGSSGPTGLLEKELVLDVALRLGELVSANLGSEVVYTRSDDNFVPLETRTQIANDSKADLFVSIHANSSTIRSVSGVETYFLSFTNSKEALDVAARENATSQRSVFELRELLQKIALQEKIDESRDFAGRVNSALHKVWVQNGPARNRGVKKAPFVVLIGASMPSILTEIGFISNPRDEKELRKPETRQKIAEALYKGIAQYADSLSHFAVARRAQDEE